MYFTAFISPWGLGLLKNTFLYVWTQTKFLIWDIFENLLLINKRCPVLPVTYTNGSAGRLRYSLQTFNPKCFFKMPHICCWIISQRGRMNLQDSTAPCTPKSICVFQRYKGKSLAQTVKSPKAYWLDSWRWWQRHPLQGLAGGSASWNTACSFKLFFVFLLCVHAAPQMAGFSCQRKGLVK